MRIVTCALWCFNHYLYLTTNSYFYNKNSFHYIMISEHQTAIYNQLIKAYKGPWLGVRHIFAFLGFLGFVNVYAMRVNLSIAIVAMVNDTNQNGGNSSNVTDGTCPVTNIVPKNSTDNNNIDGDYKFNWDAETQSTVLGCFFYG